MVSERSYQTQYTVSFTYTTYILLFSDITPKDGTKPL